MISFMWALVFEFHNKRWLGPVWGLSNTTKPAGILWFCQFHLLGEAPMNKVILLMVCAVLTTASAHAQRMYDSGGRQIGRVDAERYYDGSGRQIGRVDGERIYDGSGRQLGRMDGERIYDASGRQLGRIDGDRLYDSSGRALGRIDGERIYDASGRQIGRADGLRRRQIILFFYFYM
jgi:hypothetical protein